MVYEDEQKHEIEDSDLLSVRTINCLRYINLYTKEQVRKAIAEGFIDPAGNHKIKNLGNKTFREICEWAGIKEEERLKPLMITCPLCGSRVRQMIYRRDNEQENE